MSDIASTTVKEQPKLRRVPVPLGARPKLMSALRSLKMAKPICKQGCQLAGWGWWNDCPHDPYFHKTMTDIQEPVLEEELNEVTGEVETVLKSTKTKRIYDVQPNIVQVPVDIAINSKRGVEQVRAKKGYKFLEEVGFAPMCQIQGCWSQDLTVHIADGDFCSAEHAKYVKLTKGREDGKTSLVHTSVAERRDQLDAISLT